MPEGLAHDFLKLQLMNAKEDLADLTSPWGYRWGPDRDRLMETQDILEASRFLSALQDHLMLKIKMTQPGQKISDNTWLALQR